ncbi:hypothetical protein HanPI659440_Chr10g0363601 [Helianthus annuus]|nr:hypothetical protein HanPI659440_Chr10g0363601 [Helianthus annuus]
MTVLPYGLNFGVSYGLRPTYYINDNVMVMHAVYCMIWSSFGLGQLFQV